MLDPKTWELSNAPPAYAAPPPSSASGALLQPNQQDAIALSKERLGRAMGDIGTQPAGEQGALVPVPAAPADFSNPKVRRQTKRMYHDLDRTLKAGGTPFGLLESLLRQGAITMDEGGVPGARTTLPFPGGAKANDRLVEFIDRYRDFLASGPGTPDLRSLEGILGTLPPMGR